MTWAHLYVFAAINGDGVKADLSTLVGAGTMLAAVFAIVSAVRAQIRTAMMIGAVVIVGLIITVVANNPSLLDGSLTDFLKGFFTSPAPK